MVNRILISEIFSATRRAKDIPLVAAFVVMVTGGVCCSPGTHNGSMRNSDEPATLTTRLQGQSGYSTEIQSVDGKQTSRGSFELPPGRHRVEVTGTCSSNTATNMGAVSFGLLGAAVGAAIDASGTIHSGPLTACFIARPSHTYVVRTFGEGGVWKVEVFDEETTYAVQSPCKRLPQPVEIP